MEKKKFEDKKLEHLSDEELKEVTGGGDPFAEALAAMRKNECQGITKKKACESLSYCLWKLTTDTYTSAKCVYRG